MASRAASTFPQVDPRTSEVFKEYTEMSADEVERRVVGAGAAFKEWRRLAPPERIGRLAGLGEMLRARADEGAELMCKEMGKPVEQGKAEMRKCAYLVDWYAKHGSEFLKDDEVPALPGFQKSFVTYQPLGVIMSIMPWNFPMWQVVRMAVPTMMAGNAVVLKHAPNCFGTGALVEELLGGLPDVPKGLFSSLVVDVPQANSVLEHPQVVGVAFTGSEAVGRQVAAKAGGLLKKAVIELGGSDAYAVFADADLDTAAEAVVNARVLNTGQVCIAPKRAIVERSVKLAFEQKVIEKLSAKRYGVDYGPLVHKKAKQEIAEQVAETRAAGAKVLFGGPDVPAPAGDCGDAFYAPTVLTDVRPGMTAFDKEIFGPVISIVEADSDDHAVELANRSHYGLGGAIFTKDVARGESIAVKDIEAGMCFVNDFVRSDPSLPFGGVKASGMGRECAAFGMLEFVNVKTICVK